MRILRGVLIALSMLFLLMTMGLPFGVNFAFRGWYVDGGAAKIEEAKKGADQQVAELAKTLGGKVPAALQKEIDDEIAEKMKLVDIAKSMANWELALMPLALALLITLFLSKRAIPIGVAGVLIVVGLLAIFMVPQVKIGFGRFTRDEMFMVGLPAIIGAVLGLLASLIGAKKAATA
jgi:hypothetical protein